MEIRTPLKTAQPRSHDANLSHEDILRPHKTKTSIASDLVSGVFFYGRSFTQYATSYRILGKSFNTCTMISHDISSDIT